MCQFCVPWKLQIWWKIVHPNPENQPINMGDVTKYHHMLWNDTTLNWKLFLRFLVITTPWHLMTWGYQTTSEVLIWLQWHVTKCHHVRSPKIFQCPDYEASVDLWSNIIAMVRPFPHHTRRLLQVRNVWKCSLGTSFSIIMCTHASLQIHGERKIPMERGGV